MLWTRRSPPPPPQQARPQARPEDPGARAVLVQAVHGLGGVGKSALAAHWAITRAGAHSPIWWVTAETPESLDTGLAALAVALQPGLAGAPLELLVQRAGQWLGTHSGWLLILDNVSDPRDVEPLLARLHPAGRVLITSRRATGWHHLATAPVRLDVLDSGEALEMIRRILTPDQRATGGQTGDLVGLRAVCAELGFLPLAIEQAGAYLAQTGISAGKYLDLLAQYPAAMYSDGAEGTPTDRTLARIWHATLDRLTDTPLCGDILRVLAWYAPQDIPRHLLAGLGETPDVTRAIGRLAAYSMITLTGPDDEHPPDRPPADRPGVLAVHRLVQALARTPEPHDPHRDPEAITAARAYATTALGDAVPDDWRYPGGWATWRTLLPHIDALTTHTHPATDTDSTALLLNEAGLFLNDQGAPTRAANYLERALTDRRRVLGADHPDTLQSVNNLASAYQSAGDLGRAIPMFELALTDFRRVLGDDHPDTLQSVNNLASAYQAAGDLGRAIPLFELALTDRRRVLGDDHPLTKAVDGNARLARKEKNP
jgi:tetratricopeptide (TPR) repeat protein